MGQSDKLSASIVLDDKVHCGPFLSKQWPRDLHAWLPLALIVAFTHKSHNTSIAM